MTLRWGESPAVGSFFLGEVPMGQRRLLSGLFTVLWSSCAWADPGSPASFQVLPWNGSPAAFSLTFDDGDPSHLDVAVPELDKRGLKGTFFLIANQLPREEEWRKLPAAGHVG